MGDDERVRAAAEARNPHRDTHYEVCHGTNCPCYLEGTAEVARFRAENEKLEAECERHRRANLVRAVKGGYEEWIGEAINAEDWDAIPWRVCDRVRADLDRALDALAGLVRTLSPFGCRYQTGEG